jgi:hypothetical protein
LVSELPTLLPKGEAWPKLPGVPRMMPLRGSALELGAPELRPWVLAQTPDLQRKPEESMVGALAAT